VQTPRCIRSRAQGGQHSSDRDKNIILGLRLWMVGACLVSVCTHTTPGGRIFQARLQNVLNRITNWNRWRGGKPYGVSKNNAKCLELYILVWPISQAGKPHHKCSCWNVLWKLLKRNENIWRELRSDESNHKLQMITVKKNWYGCPP
jgi:hypothetical protein